jgi:MarR family transcriptional regulator, organic hydroperoxide resistance regulator
MSASDDVRIVQSCYPQIYLACHTRHVRAASTPHRLSSRDSALLSHLDEKQPMAPSALARHLGVGAPTMSAAIKRLVHLGYVEQARHPQDGRRIRLLLSRKGARAMRATSVLDAARVRRVLARLEPSDRSAALSGLALLAQAAQQCLQEDGRA